MEDRGLGGQYGLAFWVTALILIFSNWKVTDLDEGPLRTISGPQIVRLHPVSPSGMKLQTR